MNNDPRELLRSYPTKRLLSMLLSHPLWEGTTDAATLAKKDREELIDLVLIGYDPENCWRPRSEEEINEFR